MTRRWGIWLGGILVACSVMMRFSAMGQTGAVALSSQLTEITNVHQVRLFAAQIPKNGFALHLEGDVWWAHPSNGEFVLKDDSGAEELEMDLGGQTLASGQRVRIEGVGTVTPTGGGFRLGARGAVVDNDGVHNMIEKSGAIFLKAGLNPIRVEWFNGLEKYGLKVEYEGPGLTRQTIPDSVLFRRTGTGQTTNGLDYKCCAVTGEVLPDFDSAIPLGSGSVSNFEVSIVTRSEHVGVCYTGFLQVLRDGLYTFYTTSDDGSRLFVGEPTMQLTTIGPATFPRPTPLLIGQPLAENDNRWAQVEGKVTFASEEPDILKLEVTSETGRMVVEVAEKSGLSPARLLNRRIRITGFAKGVFTEDGRKVLGMLLAPNAQAIQVMEPLPTDSVVADTNQLPLLVSAADVHRLKREEAQRGYPVRIRGVITSVMPEDQAFTIQDSTRGIYVVDHSESRPDAPRIGEYLEVEGTSDPGKFAPVVNAVRVHLLGGGDLPEPVVPSWHQLMNGSLDAQYVEIQGILTSVQTNGIVLLTPDGDVQTEIRAVGLQLRDLERYEDALIRVRGCLLANWDYVTHQVKVGQIRIYGANITVDQPAPEDLFSTPRKTASELLLFDPQASAFQRVKVLGQILHVREPEYFVMDGNNGIRFMLKHPSKLEVGDTVEAVGFPELSRASPVLRETVVRKTGHAALPEAKLLVPDDLTRPGLDSTLVRIRAMLVDQRETPAGVVLEMRVGLRSFLARLNQKDHIVQNLPAGSQLELTGTYASQSVNQNVASFELLLNGASDIAVLARPPWWTLRKLLVILSALACVLAVTVLWITQLHRTVAQRTAELEMQIRERQRVEQQHAMEQERGRIAQDLHDELGSSLTEISMLGVRAQAAATPPPKRSEYLDQMSDKARQMVTALDEIVWAMNPTHNSLGSMVSYFSIYAERFLGLANIGLRFEGPFDVDDYAVDSRRRHQLFLAFKEALTNVVRHSKATEVRLHVEVRQGKLRLSVSDNGQGWSEEGRTDEMNGVINMRSRLQRLGGHFEIKSQSGSGTEVCFEMPLQ
ncbi:MAG TPA: ATP-binding protein [Verrucomicrobiae bacterium]|nr:ATP-binding protein [Verrucomicrobiae bacterium]